MMSNDIWAGVLLGRTDEGERVTVVVNLTVRRHGEARTVEHETVTDARELTVTGEVFAPRARNPHSAGQCVGEARRIVKPAKGWTLERIGELVDIWERWHLNTMRAGCAHQTVVYENEPYRRPSLELTPACPVSGYRYGSAWLVDPLPASVVARVRELLGEPTH